MIRVKVYVELIVECEREEDASDAVTEALDYGDFQEAVDSPAKGVTVTSAVLRATEVLPMNRIGA